MSEIDNNITSSEKLDSKNNNKIGNPAPTNKLENQAKPEVVQQVPRHKHDTMNWQKKKQRAENFANKESEEKKEEPKQGKFRRKKQSNKDSQNDQTYAFKTLTMKWRTREDNWIGD